MSKLRDSKTYSINDFINWNETDELELSPKFQRNKVWNHSTKSYLIDTILRGMPIPPVFFTQRIDLSTRKTLREVIDGQQRLTAIMEFKNNEITILKSHNKEYANKSYEELPDNIKIAFLEYEIPVEIIKTESNAIIYDIFARLNTNNMVLNKQELRNAKYWGDFKVIINELSVKYKSFFEKIKTFSDSQFSRMADAEFLSSLLILVIDGVKTDTPTSIDGYYKKYNNTTFDNGFEYVSKLENCLSFIDELFENNFKARFFNKKVQFFTLFAAIYHIKYNLGLEHEIQNIDISNSLKFKNILTEIESNIDNINSDSTEESEYKRIKVFIDHHTIRTTNAPERKIRINWLVKEIDTRWIM